MSVGLLAQLLTLGGMVLPILLGLSDEVVSLVLVSGAATLLVHPATLGTYSVYASYRSPRLARTAMAASLSCLILSTVLIGLIGAVFFAVDQDHWGLIFTLVALNVLGQGCYFLVLSHMTMLGSLSALMNARLIYAVANSLSMLIASTLLLTNYSLALAAAVGYLVSTAVSLLSIGKTIPWRLLLKTSLGDILSYCRLSRHVVASLLLAGFSGQSAALSLVLLGPLAAPWAVATRISNGFQTLTIQVVAPPYDIELARAIRTNEPAAIRSVYRRGVRVGLAFGVLGSLTASGFVSINGALEGLEPEIVAVLLTAVTLFWGSQIAASIVAKYLTYSGKVSTRFWWELIRCITLFLPMLLSSGAILLAILSVVMFLSMFWYVLVGWRSTRFPIRGRRRRPIPVG